MRAIVKNGLGTFIILLVLLTSCGSGVQKPEQPNVIFILTDQWRASALGYAGNDVVQTPELDNFAKEAVNFTNAVSVLPVCTPYRASLMMKGKRNQVSQPFPAAIILIGEEAIIAGTFIEC